ncbi:hypothetical protein ACE1TI_00020 [Alteribacillus sp. JSM 102045]|uniref:hypothetical protein n=1 Tax=Alteribacillus sp. JSM 102045 TaxID=1562101 RepID=UPI0035C1F313
MFFLRQNEMWQPVVIELNRSLFSEMMVCSMSTQLFHIPETENLQGNAEMHSHLVPASYHRVTASGSAQRLMNGENGPSLVQTLTNCIQNAEQEDRGVRRGLQVMENAAPSSYKPFIQSIILHQNEAERYLQNAKQTTMQITGGGAWQGQSQYSNSQGAWY